MKYVRIKQKEIKESGISVNDIELPKIKEEKKEVKEVKPLTFKELIKEIFTFLTHTDLINIIVFIFELLIIALVIIVFKFPIELIIDFGPKLFNFITDSKVLGLMLNIWTLIFNIVYTIGGIYAYIKICEVRFANLSKRK